MMWKRDEIAKMMDQAALKPSLTESDILSQCEMCRRLGIGHVCVRPTDVALAASALIGSGVAVSCVVGFPHGAARTETKVLEAELAIADGASELDMVINIGKLRSGRREEVLRDIRSVVELAHSKGALVKVILECCLLTEEEIKVACGCAEEAGADFVKSSTGFNGEGATPETIRAMLDAVGGRLRVKASGGIRSWDQAVAFAEMGVARLGVSGAEKILAGAPRE